ncbi:MAG: putative toxin-antitoxin system toxin component, PIN family [Proteobacteria bacterium]|nr:putative toxin-antitoxin system toxin component, PIN family [Pseudomonadota bacterium]MBS0461728.1 putative toxin-antitoxin system toxin component, PIN family [Pseudomonadota bacterium]MBS0463651.1 putative toxin-antitoxin system toxin component, PIN family [Pseudomonadota bacterium]
MHRVVLDTSVVVAAFRSRNGASNLLLRQVALGSVRPLLTTALYLEYEEVLSRPEHRLASGLEEDDVAAILAAIASAAEPVEVHFRWRPQLPDPADELVLEAAVNGRAQALITHNLRDFEQAAKRFHLPIVTPKQWIEESRS